MCFDDRTTSPIRVSAAERSVTFRSEGERFGDLQIRFHDSLAARAPASEESAPTGSPARPSSIAPPTVPATCFPRRKVYIIPVEDINNQSKWNHTRMESYEPGTNHQPSSAIP